VQKIYVELVFLDNFIINLLILLFTSLLTGTKKRWGRFAASAAIGGAYACAVFGADGLAVSIVTKTAVSLLMCFTAYYAKGEKSFWKNVCAFYIASFVFAGAMYAAAYCFDQPKSFGAAIVVKPAVRYILSGLAAGAALTGLFSRVRRRTAGREARTVSLTLHYKERRAELKCYIDTGNMLTEPLSGLDVIFVSAAAARSLFDRKTFELLTWSRKSEGAWGETCRGSPATGRLRLIPCETALGTGVFYGIEIDGIELKGEKQGAEAVVCIARGAVAYGCEAVIGCGLMDKLMKGAGHDKVSGEKNSGMDTSATGAGG
jgi:stage II sporulation protein GA (sporulation sigma-E factor processing peptidase)